MRITPSQCRWLRIPITGRFSGFFVCAEGRAISPTRRRIQFGQTPTHTHNNHENEKHHSKGHGRRHKSRRHGRCRRVSERRGDSVMINTPPKISARPHWRSGHAAHPWQAGAICHAKRRRCRRLRGRARDRRRRAQVLPVRGGRAEARPWFQMELAVAGRRIQRADPRNPARPSPDAPPSPRLLKRAPRARGGISKADRGGGTASRRYDPANDTRNREGSRTPGD